MQPTLAPAPHPMRPPPQQHNEGATDQGLREHLLSSIQHGQMPNYHHRPELDHTPHNPHAHNIDPAISSPSIGQHGPSDASGENDSPDRRGKRELSQSKRAAQNRAAQRAFRQRKESHIKTLENQVRDYDALSSSFKALQAENYALREYIISLQNDLLSLGKPFPAPPPQVNIHAHREGGAGPTTGRPADPAGSQQQPQTPQQPQQGQSGQQQPPQQQQQPSSPVIDPDVSKASPGGMGQPPMGGHAPTADMRNMPTIEQQLQESAAQAVAQQQRRESGAVAAGKRQMANGMQGSRTGS